MPRKKKEIDLDELDFKSLLEETVACSILGRTIASFGATLTGKEKYNAKLVYLLLKAGKKMNFRTPTTAYISEETKSKKPSPKEAIKWFAKKYPKKAEPLLKKLQEEYDKKEKLLMYGVCKDKDLSNDYCIAVIADILEIPRQDAAVMYHGAIKPRIQRIKEEEGLVKVVMK